jgi:peptidyl-prolyl cis-trans isomerase D
MALRGSSLSKGFVWVILALLIVGLAGFGATNLSGTIRSVGAVGDKQIEVQRYVQALQQELRKIEQQIGQPITFQQAQSFGIDRQVMQELLMTRAVDYEASQLGLSIGDANLRKQVIGIPAFQGIDGSFSRDNYQFALENAGMNEAEFEENLREETSRSLVQAAVLAGTTMPDIYANQLMRYSGERRNFTWAQLVATDLDTKVGAPTGALLEAFYNDHIALYTSPEIKQITYASLTPAQLLTSVEVPTSAIAQLYQTRDAEFNKPERRLVDRLAFADLDSATQAKGLIEADAISFDQLVLDRGLALADVDMGDMSQTALGDAGAAVFDAALDQVVGPFGSDIGPALFRVNGILKAQKTSLETASGQLRSELALDLARSEIDEQVSTIDDLLAAGATLEDLADETDMELARIDWHSGIETDLAAHPEFKTAAINVSADGFPELIALQNGGVFAMRLDSIREPQPKPLARVRGEVAAEWSKRETMARLRQHAEILAGRLSTGATFEAVGLTPQIEIDKTRRDAVLGTPESVITQVFEATPGTLIAIDHTDSVVLVRLDNILPRAEDAANDIAIRSAISTQAGNDLSQDIFIAFARDIQTRVGFEMDQQALNAVHAQFQ